MHIITISPGSVIFSAVLIVISAIILAVLLGSYGRWKKSCPRCPSCGWSGSKTDIRMSGDIGYACCRCWHTWTEPDRK